MEGIRRFPVARGYCDPVQTYVILTRDGEVIYGYGNEALRGDIHGMRLGTGIIFGTISPTAFSADGKPQL